MEKNNNKKLRVLEVKVARIEKMLKINPIIPGVEVECSHCGYGIKTKSKLKMISCSSCGQKTKNTSIKDEKN